jgi:hypothetical protein
MTVLIVPDAMAPDLRRYVATLIPAFLRRQRNQRRLTLEMFSAKVGP